MALKTLELDLGALEVGALQTYATGWYRNTVTGQYYYYDASTNQWYVYTAGLLYALGYMNPAPKTVSLSPGDKLKITISFQYRGPAITGVLSRWAIGVYGALGFTEKVWATPTIDIPANLTSTPVTVTKEVTLQLPATGVGTDWNDIYVKMWGGTPDIGGSEQSPAQLFGYENALEIIGVQVSITDFKILDFVKV